MSGQNSIVGNFDDEFRRFFTESKQYDMLSPEEETELFKRYKAGDKAAERKIIRSHYRLVAAIARKYRGYNLPLGDLVGEGRYGLVKAINNFNPDQGNRFATYAMWWIRASVQQYVLENSSIVKFSGSTSRKKLFFGLRRAKAAMGVVGLLNDEQAQEIAEVMGVPHDVVLDMDQRLTNGDYSLNYRVGDDGDTEMLDFQADTDPLQDEQVSDKQDTRKRRELISKGMEGLKDREKRVIMMRHRKDEPASLQDLAEEMSVSRERVRQIETNALRKLKRNIETIMTSEAIAMRKATAEFEIVPSA
jgi:RNA polymerase sigma-32 factor